MENNHCKIGNKVKSESMIFIELKNLKHLFTLMQKIALDLLKMFNSTYIIYNQLFSSNNLIKSTVRNCLRIVQFVFS